MGYLLLARYGAIAAIAAFLAWATIDRFHLAAVVKAEKACVVAAKSDAAPLGSCDPAIAARTAAARQAAACDTALAATDLYAIRAACSGPVKLLQAKGDAAIADAADLREQLSQAGADRDAAVVRAEARATTTADRNARNAHIIQTAPRQPDGRVHCDADCMRAIAGE